MPSQHPASKHSRIAVIGAGISGMGAAYHLGSHSQVTLFEEKLDGKLNDTKSEKGVRNGVNNVVEILKIVVQKRSGKVVKTVVENSVENCVTNGVTPHESLM